MKESFFSKTIAIVIAALLTVTAIPLYAAEKVPVAGFTDVTEGKWYADAVAYVAENDLMTGTTATTFAPSMELTRAMSVLILAKIADADLTAYTSTRFDDVPEGKWYTSAVAWADENDVANGTGENFQPHDSITREQFALMIYKFAEKYEITNMFPAGPENADGFADADSVHAWAKEGVDWAVYNGVISGMGDNMIDPRGTATRAQAAQIFYNLDYMSEKSFLPPDTADFDALTVEESDKPRIICWGDSLTASGGASESKYTYPRVLASISRLAVRNYGVGGETSGHIAMRQGAIPLYVAPVTIPAESTPIEITLLDEDGDHTDLGYFGNAGLSPITIAGVRGKFYYSSAEDRYLFTRDSDPDNEEVVITRPTRVITSGMEGRTTSDIQVIFIGTNNGYSASSVGRLIEIQREMVEFSGSDKYVIIGMTSLERMPDIADINAALAEEWGDNFLDIRSYFLTEGLEAAGITPTEEDLANIERGEIPASLLSDGLHGNDHFYRLLAEQVYQKIIDLGYVEPNAE